MSADLDKIDRLILRALQRDSGRSQRDLADDVGLSQNALWRRLKRLQESGIIKGQTIRLNPADIGLGLFTAREAKAQGPDKALVKRYFMHGTSHHLGLDVHDVSPPHEPFAEGMVFTIEPGIYIREESLGVRLENDVVIGRKKNVDLMADIPIEADEIEELMNA